MTLTPSHRTYPLNHIEAVSSDGRTLRICATEEGLVTIRVYRNRLGADGLEDHNIASFAGGLDELEARLRI